MLFSTRRSQGYRKAAVSTYWSVLAMRGITSPFFLLGPALSRMLRPPIQRTKLMIGVRPLVVNTLGGTPSSASAGCQFGASLVLLVRGIAQQPLHPRCA